MRAAITRHGGLALALIGLLTLIAALAVALGSDGGTSGTSGELTGGSAAQQAKARRGKRGPKGPPGPKGKRGKRGRQGPQGIRGPQGAAGANNERVYNLNVDWSDAADAAGNDSASRTIPGVGTLKVACPTSDPGTYPGDRRLTLTNESGGKRVVATLTTFLDDSSAGENVVSQRQANPPAQIGFGLPQNGMISGNISVEPISGNGGPASSLSNASLILSSYYQTNDPGNPANNWCHVSAQLVVKGAP